MAPRSQYYLLRQRRFAPFFATQFLGAFNDNVFKNTLLLLIAFQVTTLNSAETNALVNLSAGLFILPFFLFSAFAGQLADKYEKSRLIRYIKLLEIVIMVFAAIGFYLQNIPLLIGILFLMGTQSALYGPVKYGIIPQLIHDDELVGGNGLVEMGTFLAILLGTAVGGLLANNAATHSWQIASVVVLIACFGYAVSRWIPAAPATDAGLKINWNPFAESWRIINYARGNRTVFLAIIGISWFWLFGATFLTQLPGFTRDVLHGDESVVTLLLVLFSVGVGVGSLLCERMSDHRVELGLVPFGSIGLTLFGIDLFFASPTVASIELITFTTFVQSPSSWRLIMDIILIGTFGGFYIVPLYALIQQRSERSHLSRMIAANNIFNALFMVASAIIAAGLLSAGLSIEQLLLVTAIMNGAVAIYIYGLVPEFLLRFVVWILINTIYRVRKEGLEQIPEDGAAVLVCNHVSLVDALVIGGCIRRPVRFVMYYKIFQLPLLKFLFRTAGAIPIAGKNEDPDMHSRAFDDIAASLNEGHLVCIFPEGRLTEDGGINEFRPGVERIIARTPVPVIAMALRGLWGSLFSRKVGARSLKYAPWHFWHKITLAVGEPIGPRDATAEQLWQLVAQLRGEDK